MMADNKAYADLVIALNALTNPPKNAVNPHFKNRYADLASIRDHVVPVLADNNLALAQTTKTSDGRVVLVTRLIHASGDVVLEGEYPVIVGKQDAQGYGSGMTYARRYALCALLNIAADDDDDGNEASKPASKPKAAPPRKATEAEKTLIASIKLAAEQRDSVGSLTELWHEHAKDIDALPTADLTDLKNHFGQLKKAFETADAA